MSYNKYFKSNGKKTVTDHFPSKHLLSSFFSDKSLANLKIHKINQTKYYKNSRTFLTVLKYIGANYSNDTDRLKDGGYKNMRNMFEYYDDQFGSDKGVAATYEILLIEGQK